MFAKITGFIMSIVMFICSLFGISFGGEETDKSEMLTYNSDKTVFTVNLEENGTTGYKWNVKISDESVLKLVKNEYTYSAPADMVGAPGTRSFSFAGIKEGETTVVLSYERNWESGAADTVTLSVKVLADKTVQAEII